MTHKHPEDARQDAVESGTIEALGYTQVYKRVLRGFGQVCLVIALTAPLGAQLVVAFYQLTYGGYFGMVWGWVIPSILILPSVLCFGELCSAMPVNGATFWWIAALSPPKVSRSLSFISGCTIVLSLFTGVGSFAFATSSALCRAIPFAEPSFNVTPAIEMGIAMGVVCLWAVMSTTKLDRISMVFITCAAVMLAQMAAYIIGVPAAHAAKGMKFATGKQVFGSYENYSDWGPGVAAPMTWFAAIWVNSAWVAPAYLIEGTHDARRAIPRAMLTSYSVTAITGLIVCVITAFCISDMDTTAADETGFPLFTLLEEHWTAHGAFAFIMAGVVPGFFGGSGYLLANSFQLAAFARDGGLPFSNLLTYVHPKTNTPVYASSLLSCGALLILLIGLSTVASSTIFSLSVMASLITQSVPFLLRLIAPPERYVVGPWNLGCFSKPIFLTAFVVQWYVIIMEALPSSKSWTLGSFNWNWVVTLAAIVLSTILYLIWGSRYIGPDLEKLRHFVEDRRQFTAHKVEVQSEADEEHAIKDVHITAKTSREE